MFYFSHFNSNSRCDLYLILLGLVGASPGCGLQRGSGSTAARAERHDEHDGGVAVGGLGPRRRLWL